MTDVNVTRIEVEVNVDQQQLGLDIEPSYVDLVLTGPGIQGPVGADGPQGPQGIPGVGIGDTGLVDLKDVVAAGRVDGSVLVYNSSIAKFVVDDVNTVLTLADGGNF